MLHLFTRLLTLPRWVSVPLVLGTVGGLIAAAYPGGLSAAYADLRDAPALTATVEEQGAVRSRLCGRLTDVRERMVAKEELIAALVHGDVSLAEVAGEFEAMNAGDETLLTVQRLRYGDLEATELAASNVLDYVRIRVAADGGSSVIVSRLEGEYQRMFGHPAPTR